jgi:hypothetical protein
MQKRKILLIIVMVVTVSGLALAGSKAGWFTKSITVNELPDAKDEYKRIFDHIKNDTCVNMEGVITLYDGEKPSEIKEKTAFRFMRIQEEFYSQLSFLQTFCNGKLVVQLDTVNQVIVIADAGKREVNGKGRMQPSLDQLFNENADFKITGEVREGNNNERIISFESDFNPEIKSCALTYDPATYLVKRAVIQWWKDGGTMVEAADSNRVWISHIDYQRQPASAINIDEEINKIITIKKDQIEPALKYHDYQMHVSNPEQ